MKRAGDLFPRIIDRDNLRLAFHKAFRGKQSRAEPRAFAAGLEANLARLARELDAETFAWGRFSQFVIRDPKERLITAPCFEERVAHHAVMNVCEPPLDRWLIADTFACRRGSGRIKAVERAARYARRHGHFLKMDVRKYFDSIDHAELLTRLEQRFKDQKLLRLFRGVLAGYRPDSRVGLPIGSLMSQHFANFYLGWFDRVVKDQWRIPGYARYMDDMALWADDPGRLRTALADSHDWLSNQLRLTVKPNAHVNRTRHGMDFLGCRVFPDRVTLTARGRRRYRVKSKRLEAEYAAGRLSERELQQRATALAAFTTAAGVSSWRFRAGLINRTTGAVTRLGPGDPGRELEQQRQELPVGEP